MVETSMQLQETSEAFRTMVVYYGKIADSLTSRIQAGVTDWTEAECRYVDLHMEALEHMRSLERITRTLAAIRDDFGPDTRFE